MVELLAPVGKIENAYAAIENGANALFVGGKSFNARHYADNFTDNELEEIVKYAKLRDVKVHVTVNITVKENETKDLIAYIEYLSQLGVDALIVQDFAVVSLVKKHFPQMVLHASTQLSAHSIEDVLFLKEVGFDRVVLARELQLEDIKEIIKKCDIEIETFIHGALCYSYSGQCLMSSFIGGRSGNRGRCAQPCRMKYTLLENDSPVSDEEYLLSLKDICTIEDMPELIEAGITSFKIEGRMKSPEYVASVVKSYRKYIDLAEAHKSYKVEKQDMETMQYIFNRGGFSKGYYHQKAGKDMTTPVSPKHIGVKVGTVVQFNPKNSLTTIKLEGQLNPGDGIEIIREGRESVGAGISKHFDRGENLILKFDKFVAVGSPVYLTKNHQLIKSLKTTYQKSERKMPVALKIKGEIGEPLKMDIIHENWQVHCEGEVLTEAVNAPFTKEKAVKQLTKLGSTPFSAEEVTIEWPENCYVSIKALNELRRETVETFEKEILKVNSSHVAIEERPQITQRNAKKIPAYFAAHVTTLEQLEACLKTKEITRIYWEWQYDNELSQTAYHLCEAAQKAFYIAFPSIMKSRTYDEYRESMLFWEQTDCKGYLLRTYGQFYLFKGTLKERILDYNFNVINNEAISYLEELGANQITLSLELTKKEERELKGPLEKIIYGYMPLMTTEQCLLGQSKKCKRGSSSRGQFSLLDRKGVKWPLQTDCKACIMQILMEKPLLLNTSEGDEENEHFRIQFTHETLEETERVLQSYLKSEPYENKGIEGTSFKMVE